MSNDEEFYDDGYEEGVSDLKLKYDMQTVRFQSYPPSWREGYADARASKPHKYIEAKRMNDVTKQLVLELSADLFRDAIKAHYHHGIAEGTSLNFHNIARDSVQAAHSFYRVANQELYTAGAGSATQREAYWWVHSTGYEQGAKGLPFNEPEVQALYEGQPELFDAYANGWHAGDMKRAAHLAAQQRSH